jgi:hypothetical protein
MRALLRIRHRSCVIEVAFDHWVIEVEFFGTGIVSGGLRWSLVWLQTIHILYINLCVMIYIISILGPLREPIHLDEANSC